MSASGKSQELLVSQSLEHETAHANVDVGFGMTGSLFNVTGEAPGPGDPTEGAHHDQALAHELEALGVAAAADNVEMKPADGRNPLTHSMNHLPDNASVFGAAGMWCPTGSGARSAAGSHAPRGAAGLTPPGKRGKDKPALCDTGVAQRGLLGGILRGERFRGKFD